MTVMDDLLCLGGPLHGKEQRILKGEDAIRLSDFPSLRPMPSVLPTRGPRITAHNYHRLSLAYPGQPGGFDVLAHESLTDQAAAAAYRQWRSRT